MGSPPDGSLFIVGALHAPILGLPLSRAALMSLRWSSRTVPSTLFGAGLVPSFDMSRLSSLRIPMVTPRFRPGPPP